MTAAAPEIRAATRDHAPAMAALLNRIIDIGGTTGYREPFDAARIVSEFIAPARPLSCVVALDGGRLVGFQALVWCDPDWPEDHRLPADWASIATYVDPDAQGQGIGGGLMAETLRAACDAGAASIDATIRRHNAAGLAYYARMGFEDYRAFPDAVSMRRTPA
ncbi:MAG: GNAT family N-acetyltransferase [Pseudomonadota bacterium]